MYIGVLVLKREEPLVREEPLIESVVHGAAVAERPQGFATLMIVHCALLKQPFLRVGCPFCLGTWEDRAQNRFCTVGLRLLCRIETEKQLEPLVNAGELARRDLPEDAADPALVDRTNMIDERVGWLREATRTRCEGGIKRTDTSSACHW